MDLDGNAGTYGYKLEVEHDLAGNQRRVHSETLLFNGKPLVEFNLGTVQMYRDDHSEGPEFQMDWSRSVVSSILPSSDNTKLTWFKRRMGKSFVLRPEPTHMTAISDTETTRPDYGLNNFASWYRTLTQEKPSAIHELFSDLKQIFHGFEGLVLRTNGGTRRVLQIDRSVDAVSGTSRNLYGYDELSDGERMLIALYAILRCQTVENSTISIDEPGNFVSLEELQPWLFALEDQLDEWGGQMIIISHHPDLLDQLASSHGRVFRRSTGGPTRVTEFEYEADEPLKPSELIARGRI